MCTNHSAFSLEKNDESIFKAGIMWEILVVLTSTWVLASSVSSGVLKVVSSQTRLLISLLVWVLLSAKYNIKALFVQADLQYKNTVLFARISYIRNYKTVLKFLECHIEHLWYKNDKRGCCISLSASNFAVLFCSMITYKYT